MNSIRIIICFFCLMLFFVSCGTPTMDEDARKAAEFTNLSTQRAMESEWSSSDKFYRDAQEIIEKYRVTPQFEEFYSLYNGYLEAKAYENMNGHYSEE